MFLFGMHVFEDAIKNLTTKTFKKILRNFTQNRFVSIFTGAFVTAILQSSSVVSLIILAFV
jgi:phosphate:Na+ symporter